jgi:4-hydroxybenzoate polyprenyltransferase
MDFRQFSNLIMIEQTLFALPFALIGLLFAGGGNIATWVWTTIALVSARTAGMSFNRVIDAKIDGKNPRTRDRLIPKGEVSPQVVLITAVLASLALIFSAYMLNPLCFYLSFPAVFLLATYSYFKRFSASSHFYLGLVEAAAPIGGYLAATGTFSLVPFILGLAIMTWIAGLDIVYAIQDMNFDAKEGLHSIPVRMGKQKALILSASCYVLSMASMVYAGFLVEKKAAYWICLAIIAIIFCVQQTLARAEKIASATRTFFKINMLISPLLLLGTFIDLYF